MRSEEEFEQFLRETLLPQIQRLRAEYREALARRRALRLPLRHKAPIWLAGLVLVAFVPSTQLLLAAIGLPFLIDLYRMRKVKLPRGADAKQTLLGQVVVFHGPDFGYEPWGRIPQREFEASRLFDGRVDRYAGEDLITGKVGGTAFRMSELRVQRRKGKRGGRPIWETVFSGLFVVADFPKHVEGPLYVLPDGTERVLGTLVARALQSLPLHGRGTLVQLESPAFERHFRVHGPDPIEARYVLTPSFMRRLVRFRESTNEGVRLVIKKGVIALALPLPGDLFHVHRAIDVDERLLRSWATDLHFAVGILEELDLHTRIWSKA